MPDDYYVSQHSGEEIDALLGIAGAGAVRYDAAQSLTDAQKLQARGNINAAPGGHGLGDILAPEAPGDDADKITTTGWYIASINTPVGGWWPILSITYGDVRYQFAFANILTSGVLNGTIMQRSRQTNDSGWKPWEYINPSLDLGVEYRTTERFLRKPVYVKAINFGAVAIGLNQVSFMSDVDRPIRCYAMLTDRNTTIPWIGTPGTDQSFCSINGSNARIQSTAAFPDGAVVFVGYYYKTNE